MKDEIIKNLNDLIEMYRVKVGGQQCAIDILRRRENKAIRELIYLKSKYDSEIERATIEKAIEIVRKAYE